ncbi:Uncharacterized protein OBRU01_23761, partial [Operophtera brumata]
MEPLLHDCLMYCHAHMSDIVKTTSNLACLSEAMLTRLAAMYTNAELETVKDRKDKIQSRLYCKMILNCVLLMVRCNKLLGRHVAEQVPCQPGCLVESERVHNVAVRRAALVALRVLAPVGRLPLPAMPAVRLLLPCLPGTRSFIISPQLYGELRSWRCVYWRLWADCHFLRCQLCDSYFPAYQLYGELRSWRCVYWRLWADCHFLRCQLCDSYFPAYQGCAPLAAGRYPCCGERAYRYETVTRNTGCQFREHAPEERCTADGAVLEIYNKFRDIIAMRPPQLMFPERLTKLVGREPGDDTTGRLQCKEVFWWEGIQLVPPRPPLGLLGKLYTSNNKFNLLITPYWCTKKGVPATSGAGGDSTDDCGEQSSSSESEQSSASARSDEDAAPRRRGQRLVRQNSNQWS